MKFSKKTIAVLVTAGVLAAGAIAVAAPYAGDCGGRPGVWRDGKFDPAAFADKRLSRLKEDLKITAEQEPLWQAFADKTRNEVGKGFASARQPAGSADLTAPERMDRRITTMKQRLASLEAVNDSFNRLYQALTPEQRKVADEQAARMGRFGFKHARHHHGRRDRDRTPRAPSES